MSSQEVSDDMVYTIDAFRPLLDRLALTIQRAQSNQIDPHTIVHLKTILAQLQQLRHELQWHNETNFDPNTAV